MKRLPRIPRPRLRTLLLFLLLLVAGAAVNVAVAWGCMYAFPKIFVHPSGGNPERDLTLAEAGKVIRDALGTEIELDSESIYAVREWRFGWYEDHVAWGDPEKNATLQMLSAGWPCRALCGWHYFYDDDGANHWALSLPVQLRPTVLMFFLPLRPIWPGFAINTVFYAGVCWLLFIAPFAVRRRRRIKRGLCPACAYPVGTSNLCTECGKPVAAPPGGPVTADVARGGSR